MSVGTACAGLREVLRFDNAWQIIAQRVFRRGETTVTYQRGRTRFVVDHAGGDPAGTRACFIGGMYRDILPLLALPRDRPLRVLDIGANGGAFTLILHERGYEFERAIAVELNPRTAARLARNMEMNLGARAEVLIAAMTGNGRAVDVQLGHGGTGDSLYASAAQGERLHIRGITLDAAADRLGPGEIHLMKMDIEGAETETIESTQATSLRRTNNVVIEIHREADVRRIQHILIDAGLTEVASPVAHPGVHAFSRSERTDALNL